MIRDLFYVAAYIAGATVGTLRGLSDGLPALLPLLLHSFLTPFRHSRGKELSRQEDAASAPPAPPQETERHSWIARDGPSQPGTDRHPSRPPTPEAPTPVLPDFLDLDAANEATRADGPHPGAEESYASELGAWQCAILTEQSVAVEGAAVDDPTERASAAAPVANADLLLPKGLEEEQSVASAQALPTAEQHLSALESAAQVVSAVTSTALGGGAAQLHVSPSPPETDAARSLADAGGDAHVSGAPTLAGHCTLAEDAQGVAAAVAVSSAGASVGAEGSKKRRRGRQARSKDAAA